MTPVVQSPPEGTLPVEAPALELGTDALRPLAATVAPPRWLREVGISSWYLLGLLALLVGLVWLLGLTQTIVIPLVAAAIIATVTSPVVRSLEARGVRRSIAVVVVLVALLALAVVVVLLVLGGIVGQDGGIAREAQAASARAEGWMTSVGVGSSTAANATSHANSDVPGAISTLVSGVASGIQGIASLAFGMSLALLSLFFLLKDGPSLRAWLDGHLGLPRAEAETVTGDVLQSLRGYFRGVTLVAAFNGVVVSLAALLLDVPLAGTIGVVTFVAAYVPFIGAFVAGAFAVVLALGASGTTTALIMLVVVILANGLLQNLVQPFAMGAALDLHPLVVLVVTISAGCLLGMGGLILAAPLTSAAVHIARDLSSARAAGRAPA